MRETDNRLDTTPYTTDDERWDAVAANDRAADAVFVYAVATTGIYCRPSCPSRRPRRENVRFFDTPDSAENADSVGECFGDRLEQSEDAAAAAGVGQ